MDLQNISSAEKIDNVINEILKDLKEENKNLYFIESSKLYLKALILYIRSEKATEDDLFEEIYKIAILPLSIQEAMLTEKREKDYYAPFDKFLGSAITKTKEEIIKTVSIIMSNKIKE